MKSKIVIQLAVCASAFFSPKNLFSQTSPLGSTDLDEVLKSAPALPRRLEDAAKIAFGSNVRQPDRTAMDNFYLPFEEKTRQKMQPYKDFAQQKMGQNATTASPQDYETEAVRMANQSPILASMGGVENIKNMNTDEARAAALRAAAQFMAKPPATNPAPQNQLVEQSNRIMPMQEIQLKISELQQKIGATGQVFEEKIRAIEQASDAAHDEIRADFSEKMARVPLIVSGEMQIPDPALANPLQLATAAQHREIARIDLPKFADVLAELSENYRRVAAEYVSFLKENRHKIYGGTSAQDVMQGLNTELPMVNLEASLIHLGLELSQHTRDLTEKLASWEKHFLEVQAQFE